MSTIKSSDQHLILNADGSNKSVKFQANGVEKASISSAGAFTSTTIDATALTGTVPNASFPSTLPAISGANLTGLPPSGGSVTATADGAISAHQSVILQANGTVKAVAGSTITDALPLGAPSTFDGNNNRDVIGFDLDPTTAGKGAIGWRDGSSWKCVVFTTSGSTVTYGTVQTLCTVGNGFRGDSQQLSYIGGDKFIIGYIKNGDSQNSSTNGA